MKRKVRIYKKQLGGVQALQEEQTQKQQQVNDEQILASIITMFNQDSTPEEVLDSLMKAGVDQEKATQLINGAITHQQEQQDAEKAQVEGDQDSLEDIDADQQAIMEQAEQDRQDEILAQMYESDGYDDGYSEEDQFVQDYIVDSDQEEAELKKGGIPNKRTFVKKASKIIKAQMGQQMEQPKADSTDTGARQMMMASFLKTVQSNGNDALIKKDAEQVYNMTSMYPYSEGNMPEAQFGANMSKGQQRRFNRRLNRFIGNLPIPMQGIMPAGVITYPMLQDLQQYIPAKGSYQGGPRLANIDVRRVGLFGKPKEYTITFANEAIYNPTLRKEVIKQEARNQKVLTEDEIDELINREEEITEKKTETTKAEEEKVAKGKKDISGNTSTSRANTSPNRIPVRRAAPVTTTAPEAQPTYIPAPWENRLMQNGYPNWLVNTTPPVNPMDAAMQKYARAKQQMFYPQRQMGGFTDQESGLIRFVYGGDDSLFTIPQTEGKLTDSPYFENGGELDEMAFGGLFQTAGQTDSTVVDIIDANGNVVRQGTLAEAERAGLRHRISKSEPQRKTTTTGTTVANNNVYSDKYTFKQKGLPYFTSTGDLYTGYITPETVLKSIEVKNRFLRPDQMTINFGNYDPTAPLIGPSSKPVVTQDQNQNQDETWTRRQDRQAVKEMGIGRGYRLPQLFQNTMSSKENDRSPKLRNWINQKRSERLGTPFPEIKAYGGDMDYAQVGQNYPYANDSRFSPVYTDNPDLVGLSDIDLVSGNITEDLSGLNNKSVFSDYDPSVGAPDITQTTAYKEAQKDPTMNIQIDPNQANRQTQKKNLEGDFSVKGNLKKQRTNADYILGLNVFNAGANTLLSKLGERGDRDRQRQMYDRLKSDALYGSTGQYDRGTYETNSGLFRPDQMGFTGVIRDGGSVYEEGGETYMSEDQIRRFLEEGGELEFI
jgi:hypothetical protein